MTHVVSLMDPASTAPLSDLVQLIGEGEAGGAANGGANAAAGDAGEGSPFSSIIVLIAGFLVLFYITVLLPARRQRAEEEKAISAIKKNDRVITAGGIHGVVVSATPDSDIVTVRIDDNTRIKLNRSAIASRVDGEKKSDDGEDGSE
ncbi:MAG: preprotein translocase subunit YajC [Planctomycetota bacterium]